MSFRSGTLVFEAMQEASNLTIHPCSHAPCNCRVAPGERYCSDYCEDHSRHSIASADISSGSEECGCGHAECTSLEATI